MVPQDCRPKLPTTTTTTTILDALQTLSQHFPNASIHYTNHNLKPPHPTLYKTKTIGLLHNNPSLNGLQAFSKLSKTIPVNFPTAILEVHFMPPSYLKSDLTKLVLPPRNLISGHRQLTRNPLICRWQNICWHTFAPRLYNVSNRLKSFLVNGDEN